MNKEIFVQNVKMLCLKRGEKPTNACKESGVGGSFISDINRGQTPSVTKVQLLAQYLGVTTSELLGEPPPEEWARSDLTEHLAPEVRERLEPENLAGDERQLLEDYRSLNPQGQEYIRQTMHMAVQTYKKSSDLSKLEGQG